MRKKFCMGNGDKFRTILFTLILAVPNLLVIGNLHGQDQILKKDLAALVIVMALSLMLFRTWLRMGVKFSKVNLANRR